MSNERRIIKYVVDKLRDGDLNDLLHDLEMLDKLIVALPGYEIGTVLDVICGKEEAESAE